MTARAGGTGGHAADGVDGVDGVPVAATGASEPARPVAALRASEARARALIASLPGGAAFVVDHELRYQLADGEALYAVGLRPADLVGRTIFEALEPALAASYAPMYRRALAGEAFAHEHAAHGRIFVSRGVPLRDERGEVEAALAVSYDVTDLRAAEQDRERLLRALAVERARLADVFRQSPSILAVLRGPAHVFELANDAYLRLVGGRDVVGRPIREALPEVGEQGFVARLDRVLETGEPFVGHELAVRLARAPGAPLEERFVDFVYLPLVEADGTRAGVIAHGTDVTDQVRARRDVERLLAEADDARADAERADRAKSEFLATMSHEIRTPINAILGYGELLDLGLAGPVTDQQRDYLERLRASSQHLLGLVNDVLDLAKVDAGQMPVAREHAATGEAVTAALAIVLPEAQAKDVALRDGRPGDPGVPYVGDAHRVRQVLVNLLSNAVKFTPAGGTVTATCGVEARTPPAARLAGAGPWAFVRVADSGVGIAPEHHAVVFEPFVQVEQGRTRTAGGTGLGLAISRRLARLMGGDLTLESALGEGATFTLWLPAATTLGAESGGGLEPAAARGARASGAVVGYRVHGLGEVGTHLREHLEDVLDAFVSRLQGDPAFSPTERRSRAELENHTTTLLGNLAQSLVIVEQEGGPESDLLKDGGEIQRVVADLHGRQRRRLGWTEDALAREYAVLAAEVVALVRRRVPEGAGDVDVALDVLRRLLARAAETSLRAFRHAPPPTGESPRSG